MDYSIYKDDDVLSTVERIKIILSNLGINLEEFLFEVPTKENKLPGYTKYPDNCKYLPFSSRISFPNMLDIGTNGKGTSKENCRASAYSEFMERLQNQCLPHETLMLCSNNFSYAPDEKEFGEETEKILSKYNYTKMFTYCQHDILNNVRFKKVTIPFYNVKEKNLNYLPPLHFIFSANGMCAGNTPEEALVQGFSEICERYSDRQVICNRIAMPEIPKKYYKKYERIKGLIDYTEQLGWKVYVKDASLGKGLPVICTVFVNKEKGLFSYKFASQPSLPIAIERTLTEFFQGGMIRDFELEQEVLEIQSYSEEEFIHIFPTLGVKRWLFKITDKIYSIFFNKSCNYEFSPSSWVDENIKYTNKELLKFLIDRITNITNNDIFVRDVSFLGFPSYHILIPQFSELVYYDDGILYLNCWGNYPQKIEHVPDDINSLISAILYKIKYQPTFSSFVPYIPDEYILILCYILNKDYKNILKYCDALRKRSWPEDETDFILENHYLIDLIYQYFKLKEQKEKPAVIKNIINNMYDSKTVQKFYDIINNLDLEYIKNIICKARKKVVENQNESKSQEDIDMENKIEDIRRKMIAKYIENTPDQMKLAEVFDFSNLER